MQQLPGTASRSSGAPKNAARLAKLREGEQAHFGAAVEACSVQRTDSGEEPAAGDETRGKFHD
jgi:hypothetical protein